MTRVRYFLVAFYYLVFSVSLSVAATPWEAANEAYQKGKFEEAKVDYLQLANSGRYSADLFYNLGNVWFKLGDPGRAILNYQRALLLNPRLDEAKSNLRAVLKIVGNDEQVTFRDQVGAYADYFPLLASLTFWIAAFSIFPAWLKPGRSVLFWRRLCIVAALIFVTSLSISLWVGPGWKDANRALVIDSAADLKYGPAVSARSVESLQIGEQINFISERGDWTFCRASTGNLGWILTRKTERVIP
jgi:tetratricopeptide (TPR) repeat protein